TYNYGRYLAGAVESALGQTFADLEVVVVDDGSTDDTRDVIRPYLRHRCVRYYRPNHVGQPAAKNVGIRLALAPLVAFLDADDLWLPENLERQVEVLEAEPQVGVVYTRRLLMNQDGDDLEYTQPPLFRGTVLEPLFLNNFICFSSVMVRKAVLEQVGLFDESLALAID